MDKQPLTRKDVELVDALVGGFSEALPCVHFSRVSEWLAELRLQRQELQLPYVRLAVLQRMDPQLHILAHLSLIAGFYGAAEYVEVRSYCGEAMNGEDSRAAALYDRQAAEIKAACAEMGIEVRAGCWSWPTERRRPQ